MADKRNLAQPAAELRRRAEAQAQDGESEPVAPLSLLACKQLIHELRVHQIELELQNEELRRALVELESSRERYFELYDLAPGGYLTISDKGLIVEANLTAARLLSETRRALIDQPFSRFLLPEDLGTYFRWRKQLFDTGEPQSCDLQLLTRSGAVSWVRLELALAKDAGGARVIRAALSDAGERKLLGKLLERKAIQLEEATSELEALAALLPTCRGCKRIRDGEGEWRELDAYVARVAEPGFARALCERCRCESDAADPRLPPRRLD